MIFVSRERWLPDRSALGLGKFWCEIRVSGRMVVGQVGMIFYGVGWWDVLCFGKGIRQINSTTSLGKS